MDISGPNTAVQSLTILGTVIGIFVIAIMAYYILSSMFGTPTVTGYVQKALMDGKEPKKVVSAEEINKIAGSNEYSFCMWIYVDEYQTSHGVKKTLLKRGTSSTGDNPYVYLHETENAIVVEMKSTSGETLKCKVPMLPLQRWNCLCVNVFSNSINIYFNGRLYRSCAVQTNSPAPFVNPDKTPLDILGVPFGGKISGVFFRNKVMSASEIQQVYYAGPGAASSGLLFRIFGIREIKFIFSDTGGSVNSASISF
jgi:hypothetical protein